MSENTENPWVSFAEIHADEEGDDLVKVEVPPIPYIRAERLALRIETLEKLCDIAGIDGLILRFSDERLAEDLPPVAGMSGDQAVAGKIGSGNDQPEAYFETNDGYPKFRQWIEELTLTINTRKCTQAVAANGGVRSEAAWAEAIDHELRQALQAHGLKFLLSGNSRDMVFDSFYAGILAMMSDNAYWLTAVMAVLISKSAITPQLHEWIHRDQEARPSLFSFFGYEIDRALRFYMILKTRRLVAVLESDNKMDGGPEGT